MGGILERVLEKIELPDGMKTNIILQVLIRKNNTTTRINWSVLCITFFSICAHSVFYTGKLEGTFIE